jgi:hypothetical protein
MYKLTPAAYIFTHQYLNTMQQGIQSAHVVAELCSLDNKSGELARDWAKQHKVIRVLNAGSGDKFENNRHAWVAICDMYAEFHIPNAFFREPDIGYMITAFGFVLTPEIILDIEKECAEMQCFGMDPDDLPIINFLKQLNPAK